MRLRYLLLELWLGVWSRKPFSVSKKGTGAGTCTRRTCGEGHHKPEIKVIMQRWCELTAEKMVPLVETPSDFLTKHDLDIPQLDDDTKKHA